MGAEEAGAAALADILGVARHLRWRPRKMVRVPQSGLLFEHSLKLCSLLCENRPLMNAAGVAEAEPWRWRQALAPPPGLPAGLRVLWSIVEVVDLLDANARVDLVHVLRRERPRTRRAACLRPSPPRWEVHDVSRVHLLILAQQPQGRVGGCSHLPEGQQLPMDGSWHRTPLTGFHWGTIAPSHNVRLGNCSLGWLSMPLVTNVFR